MTVSLVGTPTLQEAQAHRALRETKLEVAKQAIGLLDWLLQSTPDAETRLLVDLDEAIRLVEGVKRGIS